MQREKANPGKTTYASAGNGGAAHLSAELFQQGFKLQGVHVPYKGGAPALTDLTGGQVDYMFSAITACGPLVKAGKLRAIATAFDRRIEAMPQVPTIAESGLPGFSAYEWNGLWAPASTPLASNAMRTLASRMVASLGVASMPLANSPIMLATRALASTPTFWA